jgi:cell division protein FtsA
MGGAALGRNNIVASLDLGTSKICCMIGEITRSGDIDILGYGIVPSTGIKKGNIINIDSVVQSIAKAVDQAQQMSGLKINGIVVGISGSSISILNNKGVVAIPRNEKEITTDDVDRVIQASKIMAIPYDREIIDVIPREFVVDGCDGIKDPVGMVGVRLEVSACIITGLQTAVQNTLRCVQKAGLNVEAAVLKSLATAEMLLTEDELEMGAVLLDIGAGVTEVAVFEEGCITAYDLLPIGGDFITNDLAIGLRLPFSQAEEIKRAYACAKYSASSDKPSIEIQSIGDSSFKKISQKDLAAIIEPRVHEILTLVIKAINNLKIKSMIPAGVILTGSGLLHISRSVELARNIFNLPIRLGTTTSFDKDQTFNGALGLLYYSMKHRFSPVNSVSKERSGFSLIEKAKMILKEYF